MLLSRMEHNGDASGVCVEDRIQENMYSKYVDMSCWTTSESDSKFGGKGRESNSSDGLWGRRFVCKF